MRGYGQQPSRSVVRCDWCHLISYGSWSSGERCRLSSSIRVHPLPSPWLLVCRHHRCISAASPIASPLPHCPHFLHQSSSSPSLKIPKSLNSSTSFSLRIFLSSWLLRFLSSPLCCNSCGDRYSFSPACYCFSPPPLMLLRRRPPPWLVLRHWSPFVQSAEASSLESNCSNKSREASGMHTAGALQGSR